MNHLISTKFGQFLVMVDTTANTSTIVEAKTLKHIARVAGTTRADFQRALRNISSLVLIQAKLMQGKVTVINHPNVPAELLTKTRAKSPGRPKKIVAAKPATKQAEALPVLPPPQAMQSVG